METRRSNILARVNRIRYIYIPVLTEIKSVIFFSHLNEKKLQKSLAVRKIVVPLHPLSGDSPSGALKKKSSLKDLHKQTSSTRSEFLLHYMLQE